MRRLILGAPADSDTVWDLLLDLYIAYEENAEVSLTSIGLAGNVPATTALRWIRKLAALGYLTRTPDKSDGRRTIVTLTPQTISAMKSILDHNRTKDE